MEIWSETSLRVCLRRLLSSVSDLHSPSASRNLSRIASSLFLFLSMVLIMSGSDLMTFTSSIVKPLESQNFF